MSEQNKSQKQASETSSVDWAERLKASLRSDTDSAEAADTSAPDDDLAALLRAQLTANSSSEASKKISEEPSPYLLDLSEFESEEDSLEEEPADEYEDEEEFIEEEEEEEVIDEDEEEFIDEDEKEVIDEDEEEFIDEDEEEFIDEEEEEVIDEDEEEVIDEDEEEVIDEDEEEVIDEDEEEFIDEDEEEVIDEDEEEVIDEDEEEVIDEDEEEVIDEDEEDLIDEDEEEVIDEDDEEVLDEDEEEVIDEDEEEVIDEDEEEVIDEDEEEAIDEDEEEVIDEDEEEFIDEEFIDEEYEEEYIEEYTDENEETEDAAMEAQEPVAPPVPVRRPRTSHLTDDRLNGLNPNEAMGGRRLRSLDEENKRLLEEARAADAEAEGRLPDYAYEDGSETFALHVPTADPDAPARREKPTPPRVIQEIHDPLQIGPDPQIKPRLSSALEALEPENIAAASKSYAASMPVDGSEEEHLSDTDLCLRLGYHESMRHAGDQTRVEKLRSEMYAAVTDDAPATHPDEYRGKADTARVTADYARARRLGVARLITAALGAVVALGYDLLSVPLASLDYLTETQLNAYAPVGILWALLVCLPFLPRLARGIRSLWRFEPNVYSVAALALTVAFAEGIVASLARDPYRLPLFFGAALLTLTVAALSELLVTEGEWRAFAVVSAGKSSFVLTDEPTPASAALGVATDKCLGPDGVTLERKGMTAVRVGRVADYFARTNRYNPYMGRLNYLLSFALLAAILCTGLSVILSRELTVEALRIFTATYLACLPGAYLIALTLPLLLSNRLLLRKGSAVIGTATPSDYTAKAVSGIIFSDGDALRFLHRKDITLRGDEDTETWKHLADVVFRLLDTPLRTEATIRERMTEGYRIDIAETDEHYVRLYLVDTNRDQTTEVMLGSHEALTRRGIRLPKISMEQRYKKSENSRVIYVAFNRSFHLAYAAEYRVGRSFARTVTILSELGYRVSLASYDPLLDPAMEGVSLLHDRHGVEVLRPEAFEPVCEARSAGVISTGWGLDLLYTLTACHSMKLAYRRAHLLTWLTAGLGAVLSALLVWLTGSTYLTSAVVTLWQLLLSAAMLLPVMLTVNAKGLRLPTDRETRPTTAVSESDSIPTPTA